MYTHTHMYTSIQCSRGWRASGCACTSGSARIRTAANTARLCGATGVRPGVWCASINGCLCEYDASVSMTASVNMTDNAARWGCGQ